MIIETKKLSDLKPAPYNPRKSTEKQEAQLKNSLEKFGVVEPIIFNKQTGYIVGGHFRVRELKKLGYKEVECVIVDLSEDDERELNIRLNANTGEWNWEELANAWDSEKLEEWGLDVPDFGTDAEISLYPNSCNAFKRIFPPKGYNLPSASVTQTIGRFSIISGKSEIDFFNFSNLSSLINRGLLGLFFNLLIFIF